MKFKSNIQSFRYARFNQSNFSIRRISNNNSEYKQNSNSNLYSMILARKRNITENNSTRMSHFNKSVKSLITELKQNSSKSNGAHLNQKFIVPEQTIVSVEEIHKLIVSAFQIQKQITYGNYQEVSEKDNDCLEIVDSQNIEIIN